MVRDDALVDCGCESVMKAGGGVGSGEAYGMRAVTGDLVGVFFLEIEEIAAGVADVWCVWPSRWIAGGDDLRYGVGWASVHVYLKGHD